METFRWFVRLLIWIPLVLRNLSDSGDAYLTAMLVPYMLGVMSILAPIFAILSIPELGIVGRVLLIAIGLVLYLLSGCIAYWSSCDSHGKWHERGAW